MRIRMGFVLASVALLALGCDSQAPSGGATTLTANDTLEVTGDLSEAIVLDATSCPMELMGHVSGSTSRKVDLSWSNGKVIYLDDSGGTWTGTGAPPTQKSDGSMSFDYDLTSDNGKKIHISGESSCK